MAQESTNAPGQRRPNTDSSKFSTLSFVIRQYLAGARTAMPVIVRGVRNTGGVEPVGTVDVEPLVSQLDGAGKIVSHGIIYDLPYLRMQGGVNAIILDPEVGDIGLAVVSDRDVSKVKTTRQPAAPGSNRRNHFSDGFYFGGFLNGNPAQYIRFSSEGIDLVSPTAINLKAPKINETASESITSNAPQINEIASESITEKAPNINQTAEKSVSISAPEIDLDGALSQGKGENGGDATFGGAVTAAKEVTGNNIKLSGHGHDGVEPGDGQTGNAVNL